MKKTVLTGFIISLCMLIIPLVNIKGETKDNNSKTVLTAAKVEKKNTAEVKKENKVFRVKTDSGIEEIPVLDYVTGVVAAEMPVSFGIEALKAQCVAAYTFALYRSEQNKDKDFDLTNSHKTDQSYLSAEKLKEKWGEDYATKTEIIQTAVNDTHGEYLSYDGKVALTLYHALSGGVTNNCSDVFGGELPYLSSVDSEADKLSPDYISVFSFSADELKLKLSSLNTVSTSDNIFSDIVTSKSGLVKEINAGDQKVSGTKICELLELPSPVFKVEYSSGAYNFTCYGKGHGVGMSQYGAGQLAKTGSTYKEILAHYYPGTKLQKMLDK